MEPQQKNRSFFTEVPPEANSSTGCPLYQKPGILIYNLGINFVCRPQFWKFLPQQPLGHWPSGDSFRLIQRYLPEKLQLQRYLENQGSEHCNTQSSGPIQQIRLHNPAF